MKKSLSAYLDLLRLGAALAVVFTHMSSPGIASGLLWQVHFIGHPAVIVFFVLSGFVIQYVIASKETTFAEYQIARFARLYSVVLPALVITYVCDRLGMHKDITSYYLPNEGGALEKIVLNGLFLSQSWQLKVPLLNNYAFWTLPYEFWYYQMFAAAIFFRGKVRVLLLACIALIVGPPILLNFPIWLMGVAAYRAQKNFPLRASVAAAGFGASLLGLLAILAAEGVGILTPGQGALLPVDFSPFDYLVGVLVAANIYCCGYIELPLARLSRPIAAAAGITFSLYLLHFPIMHLAAVYMPASLSAYIRGVIILAIVFACVIPISFVTEGKKKELRAFLRRLLTPSPVAEASRKP